MWSPHIEVMTFSFTELPIYKGKKINYDSSTDSHNKDVLSKTSPKQ